MIIRRVNSKVSAKQYSEADSSSSPFIGNRVLAQWDAIVGSTSQVANGAATHLTLTAAMAAFPSGGNILILAGSHTDSPTITAAYKIVGQGHAAIISGNVIISGNYSDLDSVKITGNLTVSGNNNFLKCWIASTSIYSNTGLANDDRISQE